jgi:hypothetical protein
MAQHPRSNGTALVTRPTAPAESQWDFLARVDSNELFRGAVLGVKSQNPFSYSVPDGQLPMLADALRRGGQCVYVWSFYVAASLYDGGGNWKDRRKAMAYLENDCEMPQSNARRACDTVDIVHRLTIQDDPDGVGVPSVEQVNRIARSGIKKVPGGVGIVNGWVCKKWGRWDKVTPKALADKCQRVKNDDRGVAADKKALQTAETVDGTAVGVTDRPKRTPLNTPEQQAAARLARSIDAFLQLMEAGTSMAANLEAFDREPEWLQLHASAFRQTRQALDRLEPMMDAALKLRAV